MLCPEWDISITPPPSFGDHCRRGAERVHEPGSVGDCKVVVFSRPSGKKEDGCPCGLAAAVQACADLHYMRPDKVPSRREEMGTKSHPSGGTVANWLLLGERESVFFKGVCDPCPAD